MNAAARIRVEVAYAKRDTQVVVELRMPPGATVVQAIHRSGLLERFPEIDLDKNGMGIFGETVRPDDVLRENDRVEIYRSLVTDPKSARRARAGKKGKRN